MNQREKFEAWADKAGFGLKYRESMFAAWEGAIAAQEPKQAMTDAEISDMAADYLTAYQYASGAHYEGEVEFARAIIAASSPNKELVEALKAFVFPYSEKMRLTERERIDKAEAALRAAGVEAA